MVGSKLRRPRPAQAEASGGRCAARSSNCCRAPASRLARGWAHKVTKSGRCANTPIVPELVTEDRRIEARSFARLLSSLCLTRSAVHAASTDPPPSVHMTIWTRRRRSLCRSLSRLLRRSLLRDASTTIPALPPIESRQQLSPLLQHWELWPQLCPGLRTTSSERRSTSASRETASAAGGRY